MHNNLIGGHDLLSSDRYDLLKNKSGDHHNTVSKSQGNAFTERVSIHSTRTEFFASSVTEDGGYKILAQSLSVEFSFNRGTNESVRETVPAIRPPSPLEVANKVLGFVENRLNSELESGADSERISNLLTQAREGVQTGFSQARDDIESLGLMTDKLSSEIDEGYDRIGQGLDGFEGYADSVGKPLVSPETEVEGDVLGGNAPASSVSVLGAQSFQETISHSKSSGERQVGFSAQSAFRHDSEFTLKTQDGDTISLRYVQAGAESFRSAGQNLFFELNQFQGYQLEVTGELDEGELAAISDLFAQLGEVSSLFFEDRFQDAFSSALNVGFDASEIASFSLDLSKVQVQEVRTYSQANNASEQGSIKKNQSLIDVVGLFEKSVKLLEKFDAQQFDFRELVLESITKQAIEKGASSVVSREDFSSYTERLLELLTE